MALELRNTVVNVIAIRNATDTFHFIYDTTPASHEELLKVLGRFARDPNLSMTWLEAGHCGVKAKELQKRDRSIG